MIGLEKTFEEHLDNLTLVFREVLRVLRHDGVCWMNYGDAYAGSWGNYHPTGKGGQRKNAGGRWERPSHQNRNLRPPSTLPGASLEPKNLMMMPARVAIALQADGWWIRSMLPWVKRNPMPESVKDRPVSAVEYVFMLTKRAHAYWDPMAVQMVASENTHPRRKDGKRIKQKGQDPLNRRGTDPRHEAHKETNHKSLPDVPRGVRAFRNSDLFYESLDGPHGLICDETGEPIAIDTCVSAVPEAHFATFPPSLVKPMILGSTSHAGACHKCGAPLVRVVETPKIPDELRNKTDVKMEWHPRHLGGGQKLQDWRNANPAKTVDWRPTCKCHEEGHAVPCTVMDPFGGLGTTSLVANRLQRDSIIIEISPEYAAMARDRIEKDAGFLADLEFDLGESE